MDKIKYYLPRCSLLVLLGLLIYAQTFHFDFVFDDYIFVVTNPFIKNFNNFPVMWHAFSMTRLVGMGSFALNYYFNQLEPQGYHIFNFVVHLFAVGLVWALADLLFKMVKWLPAKEPLIKNMPFMIALLFLVHPCQTQAVTYITQRFESMATVFYLGTMYFYLRARLSTRGKHMILFFGLAGFFSVLGIMTKEVVLTIPVMILASEWILFPAKDNKRLYAVLVIGSILLYLLFRKLIHTNLNCFFDSSPSESHDGDYLTPARYLLTQLRVFLTFLRLLVFPINQRLDYDYPASTGFFHPPLTLVGLLVMGFMIWLIINLRRRLPLISFGMAWMLITFSINLAPRSNVIFEHKLYLISFGFFLSVVAGLSVLVKNRMTLLKMLFCIITVLTIVSIQRNKVWANELTLWEDNIKTSPNKARVNASLGRSYGSIGRYDEAIYYFTRAIAIRPDNITYENRGIIYSNKGQNDKALEDLSTSITMDPNYPTTYIKRSWIYQTQHSNGAALDDLAHAISLNPYFVDAYIERGMLWMAMGLYPEALKDFNKAQAIEPKNSAAARYKSYCLTKMGR